jgi:hypothetical protein
MLAFFSLLVAAAVVVGQVETTRSIGWIHDDASS